ncbi:MAG TPA: hypothetical protein VND45_09650 [Thermoanaerobaculia bacterium]|nr:hypothetical protein [Thermoanaerobaculia bacterium]
MRRIVLPLLLLLLAACGSTSGSRPADVAKPSISINQAGPLYFASSNSATVSIDVGIRNNASVPLRVREIELRSPGMMQYQLVRRSKIFNETLAPGESRTLGVVTTATKYVSRPTAEPLAIQAIVRFEVNGRGFREIVMDNFAGSGE